MKPRNVLAIILAGLCIALGAGVAARQRDLIGLRAEEVRLRSSTQKPGDASEASSPPVSQDVPTELLRLRNQVTQLTVRRRELDGIRAENARLKVASTASNNGTASVQNYVTQQNARMVGYDTPAHTLETFLCALRNRDVTNLGVAFAPGAFAHIGGQTIDEALRSMNGRAIPGFSVIDSRAPADDLAELTIQTLPEIPQTTLRFRQLDGQWKLAEIPWGLGLTFSADR